MLSKTIDSKYLKTIDSKYLIRMSMTKLLQYLLIPNNTTFHQSQQYKILMLTFFQIYYRLSDYFIYLEP